MSVSVRDLEDTESLIYTHELQLYGSHNRALTYSNDLFLKHLGSFYKENIKINNKVITVTVKFL